MIENQAPKFLQSELLTENHLSAVKAAIKQIVHNSAGQDVSKKVLNNQWKKLFDYKSEDLSTKEGLQGTNCWKKMLGAGPHMII